MQTKTARMQRADVKSETQCADSTTGLRARTFGSRSGGGMPEPARELAVYGVMTRASNDGMPSRTGPRLLHTRSSLSSCASIAPLCPVAAVTVPATVAPCSALSVVRMLEPPCSQPAAP